MIADRHKLPCALRSHHDFCCLAGLDIGVDFQRLEVEAVRNILTDDPQLYCLTFFQTDFVGAEGKPFCRDLNHPRLLGSQMHWNLQDESDNKEHKHTEKAYPFHFITPVLRIC